MTLDEMQVGQSATIVSVGGEGALRNRLIDMGLIPRTKLTLHKVAPMGDPIEIRVRGYELTLRVEEAEKIEVIPTLVLYRGGKAVDSIVAPDSKAAIERFIQTAMERA